MNLLFPTKNIELNLGETITFNQVTGKLDASRIEGDLPAGQSSYDNTESGLEATNVQDAIDEVNTKINNIPSVDAYTKEETDEKFATKTALQTVANAIPTKTSELQNDSDFASIDDSATASNKAWSSEKTCNKIASILPTKTVGGAIANFETDIDMPYQALKCDIIPTQEAGTPTTSSPKPISGWSQIVIEQADGDMTTVKQITIDLGQTVYGGYVTQVNTGHRQLVVTCVKEHISLQGKTYSTANGYDAWLINLANRSVNASLSSNKLCSVCNNYAYVGSTANAEHYYISTTALALYLTENTFRSGEFDIGYPLETPYTVDLPDGEPIIALIGTNNVFADSGNSEVTFVESISELEEIVKKIAPVADSTIKNESETSVGAVSFTELESTPRIAVNNGDITIVANSSWKHAIVECSEGDLFILTGVGGSGNYRLYGFVGDLVSPYTEVISLCNATTSSTGLSLFQVVAPKSAKYAIFNFRAESDVAIYHIHNESVTNLTHLSSDNHIRFMVFGNSYGMDAFTYVPFILKNLGITSEIYLYRRDALTLRDIYNRWESNSATDTETDGIHAGTYSRNLYTIDTRKYNDWANHDRISMKDCLALGGWDFVTLQQWSAYSIDPTTYEPWLPLDIDLIRQSLDKATQLAWVQVWTRATHDDKSASIETFEDVPFAEYPFDFYIPCGTAIFNARANANLALLGDYAGHNLWKDGVHLQDGLPRYIAALTICETICRKFFPKKSIMFDKTQITDAILTAWDSKMPMTPCVGMNDANRLLAQYSAINACNHPFVITPTQDLPSVPIE